MVFITHKLGSNTTVSFFTSTVGAVFITHKLGSNTRQDVKINIKKNRHEVENITIKFKEYDSERNKTKSN